MLRHAKLTNPHASDNHLFSAAVQHNKIYLPPLGSRALAVIAGQQINAIRKDSKRKMHKFSELVQRSMVFSLDALGAAQQRTADALQTSAATTLVKTLQMVQLQMAISAVGMFSMFDAILQDQLQCKDGFQKAGQLLEIQGEVALKEQFTDLQLAVNALKHGKGRSYEILVKKAASLPFRVKLPDEHFFNEGDISEIATLVEVDDAFVLLCAEVIDAVSVSVRRNS